MTTEIFDRLGVHIFDLPSECNFHHRFLMHIRSVFYPLCDDALIYLLLMLDRISLIHLFIAHTPKRQHVFLTEYSQGQRVEIGPLYGDGFGCHTNKRIMLIYGNCMIQFYKSFIVISNDDESLLRLVRMLKKLGLWCGCSKTINKWRKLLIDAL
jgi:hypothetical protein